MREMAMQEYWKSRMERAECDILVDLRSEELYHLGSVPGAVNIPMEKIGELYQLPKDRTICLFCQTGEISGEFAELLADAGYDACNLTGGYREYLRSSLIDF